MSRDREEPFDPDQPTLIVTYGNTTRKYRALDREVMILGRAPNCDMNLVAAEVAPIHCLLIQGARGWRVRHFGGRVGTLLNGKPIQDEVVGHDDTLQVGSFSFKFHLPPAFRRPGLKSDVPPDSPEASHLRRSRRNLARLALNLRRGYHDMAAELARTEEQLQQQERDLNGMRDSAKARQQAFDVLRAKHEAGQRDTLERDRQDAVLKERLRSTEADLARKSCQEPSEEARRMEIRGVELAYYARHLRRVAERAAKRDGELLRRTRELARERDQLERERAEPQQNDESRPALRERLAKVQKLKKGLAMLRTSDSAPGVPLNRVTSGPHQAVEVGVQVDDTPN
jgi:pSer/pThr/pTyr-binding forkhead associated (FHA) protein